MIDKLYSSELEIIGAKIKTKDNTEICIISYYNPPQNCLDYDVLAEIDTDYANYIICGDLNAKHTAFNGRTTNSSGNILFEFVANSRAQVINDLNEKTYFESNRDYAEILDLIICSDTLINKISAIRTEGNSALLDDQTYYHSPVSFTLDKRVAKKNLSSKIFTKTDWTNFYLSQMDSNFNLFQHIEGLECEIIRKIKTCYEKNTKTITLKANRTDLPSNIVELIKKKRKARRELYENRNESTKSTYRSICKLIKKLIFEHKNKEWDKFIKSLGKNPLSTKKVWNKIKLTRQKPETVRICNLHYQGAIHTTDRQKCTAFSDHLESILNEQNSTSFDNIKIQEVEESISKLHHRTDNM